MFAECCRIITLKVKEKEGLNLIWPKMFFDTKTTYHHLRVSTLNKILHYIQHATSALVHFSPVMLIKGQKVF